MRPLKAKQPFANLPTGTEVVGGRRINKGFQASALKDRDSCIMQLSAVHSACLLVEGKKGGVGEEGRGGEGGGGVVAGKFRKHVEDTRPCLRQGLTHRAALRHSHC